MELTLVKLKQGRGTIHLKPKRSKFSSKMSFSFFLVCLTLSTTNLVCASWVDPDTSEEFLSTPAFTPGDDREYRLVFSDEFDKEGRSFADGEDPRWTAINKNDYTNDALHFYSSDNVQTTNGVLNITTIQKKNLYKAFDEKKKTYYTDAKHIQSGMIQGWNKFCFIGGVVEISAKLPGNATTGGLWPALWMLGNLARATYVGSSDYVWPFSYNQCTSQNRNSQEIDACSKVNHYGMEPGRGRGSPEIDILEAMPGEPGKLPHTHVQRPYFSTSLQIAPGVKKNRPVLGQLPKKGYWYEGLEYGNQTNTGLNPFFYGVTLEHKPKQRTYQSDAISANTQIKRSNFQSQHRYRIEWEPPNEDGTGGYIKWFFDGIFVYGISGQSLTLTGTEIPSEPMYMLLNTAVSSSWGFPDCPDFCECECFECGNPDCDCGMPEGYCENFPASFEIDYVRVYQAVNESKHVLGCSPVVRPTRQFIEGHRKRYMAAGDKQPLLDVKTGGARCINDDFCGGSNQGTCSIHGFCECLEGYTGSSCLAHAGFYDFDANPHERIALSTMLLPHGLLLIIGALVVGFVAIWGFNVFGKHKEERRWSRLNRGGSQASYGSAARPAPLQVAGAIPSYQGTGVPIDGSQQRVVTYCVIDKRLVDGET